MPHRLALLQKRLRRQSGSREKEQAGPWNQAASEGAKTADRSPNLSPPASPRTKPSFSLSSLSFRRPSFSAPSNSLPPSITSPHTPTPPSLVARPPWTSDEPREQTLRIEMPPRPDFSQDETSPLLERPPSPLVLDDTTSISSLPGTPYEESPSPISSTYHPPSSFSYFNLSRTEFHLPSPSASSMSRINLLQRENEPRSHFSSWGTSLAGTSRYNMSLQGNEEGSSSNGSRESNRSRRSRQSRNSPSGIPESLNKENPNVEEQNRFSVPSSSAAASPSSINGRSPPRPRLIRSSTTSAVLHQDRRITCQEFLNSPLRSHEFCHSSEEESQAHDLNGIRVTLKSDEKREQVEEGGDKA